MEAQGEWIDRIAAGDERALAELHRALARRVHAFALRHVDCPDAADDVVCETFQEVWRTAGRFAGQSSVATWVLGIARHKALDEVRRRSRLTPLAEDFDLVDDRSESAADRLDREADARRLHAELARLPAEQRECLHLVFFQELGLAEVAALQGVPENTVKTRLFHARRKLRERLEPARVSLRVVA